MLNEYKVIDIWKQRNKPLSKKKLLHQQKYQF